jgi:hypothetical protein
MPIVMTNTLLLIQPSNMKYNGSMSGKILISITCWSQIMINLECVQGDVVGNSWNRTHVNHGAPHVTLHLDDDQTMSASDANFMSLIFLVRTTFYN